MKSIMKIKKWQLIRHKSKEEIRDLSDADFITVGKRAFLKNNRLEAVTLPAQLSAIKTEAFLGCKRLKQVKISGETTVGISDAAFYNCQRLDTLENDSMISAIGKKSFKNCYTLSKITLGEDLRRVGDEAFRACRALKEITLPSGLKSLGEAAFADCTELSRVTCEEGVSSLSANAFRGCISLTEVDLSSDISVLPKGVFRDCSALCEITVPYHVQIVGSRAFYDCARLESVILEAGVQKIGAFAFAATPRLREVAVGNGLQKLGFAAFGLGKSEEKIKMRVETEYMLRRMKQQLILCGSIGRVELILDGKSIEERKRERRRSTLEQTPVHLIDSEQTDAEN